MNDLTVKEVEFLGDNILATQDQQGNIWAGVKWLCDGIGLSEGQIKNERLRIQTDLVLSKGGRDLILPTNGGKQEVLCLMIDYVPIWLAKISITPRMKEETPQVVKKLVEYQLKVKDILAQAFLPQYKQQETNKKPLDLKAVSIMSKSPKGNMSLVLQALDKMGYDVEGLNVQPPKVVSSDINATINRTIELIDNMIYENIELSQYIAADEENNFICIDFTRLYKEFIRYVRANNIDFDYLNEKDFKKQLKQVDYCITNRYSKKLKLFNSITNEYYKKLVRCVKLDLEKLNDALDLKIL